MSQATALCAAYTHTTAQHVITLQDIKNHIYAYTTHIHTLGSTSTHVLKVYFVVVGHRMHHKNILTSQQSGWAGRHNVIKAI